MLRKGVEAYGAKSLDAISRDFVNSFRSKNNNGGAARRGATPRGCNPKPPCSPFSASVDVAKNAPSVYTKGVDCDRSPGIALFRPFHERVRAHRIEGGNGRSVICFAREDYRVITPGASQGYY